MVLVECGYFLDSMCKIYCLVWRSVEDTCAKSGRVHDLSAHGLCKEYATTGTTYTPEN